MNAAFVLMTSAWLAGAPGHGGMGCSSCSSCAPSCDSCGKGCERESLLGKLRKKMERGGKCCEMDCGGDNRTLWQRIKDRMRKNDCCDSCPAPKCAPSCCDSCDKPGLLDRLKARFRRDDGCCDPCPAPCGGGTVIHHGGMPHGTVPDKMPKVGEPVGPPKGSGEKIAPPKDGGTKPMSSGGGSTGLSPMPSAPPSPALPATSPAPLRLNTSPY